LTALLSRDGKSYTLACDGCGQLVTDLAPTMGIWDVAWSLFTQDGWTGDILATGPHTCGRCTRMPAPPPRMIEQALSRERTTPAGRESRRLTVSLVRGTTVVTLSGDPDLAVNARLRDVVLGLGRHVPYLVVDVTRVRRLDSGTFDVLVQARRQDVAVCLAGACEPVQHALHLLCLHELLPTLPDRARALTWVRTARGTGPRRAMARHETVEVR
jgi:anti-anti-sigma regulatory factor